MMKFFSFVFVAFTISGCSYFANKFESLSQSKNNFSQKMLLPAKINYCTTESKIQFISEDEALIKFYTNFNPLIIENNKLSFVQKAVMFSLIEMARRPDVASPYARLQVYLKYNGKNYYYDFRPKKLDDDAKMSFLKGLEILTLKFIPGQSLTTLAATLDKLVPVGLNVSAEFENFLKDNRTDIIKNSVLINYFTKGDEILTKYETFNRLSFKSIIQQYENGYSTNSDYVFEMNGLFPNKTQNEKIQANCNYDLQKDTTQKDDLILSDLKKAHTIGLRDGENYFLAVSSATLVKPFTTSAKLGYFIKAQPTALPLPICELKGPNEEIVLFSTEGRNPFQHLQHLFSYGLDQVNSIYSLNELLNFSRHLFLSNPDRILYESKKGRRAQLDFFLAMNFPIYHVESLGNIYGHANFENEKKISNGLQIDDRSQARLWCK